MCVSEGSVSGVGCCVVDDALCVMSCSCWSDILMSAFSETELLSS